MDIYDQATEREERDREQAIAAARKPTMVVPFTGFCHNCDAPLAPSMRFCDAMCCEDYERRQRAASFE